MQFHVRIQWSVTDDWSGWHSASDHAGAVSIALRSLSEKCHVPLDITQITVRPADSIYLSGTRT